MLRHILSPVAQNVSRTRVPGMQFFGGYLDNVDEADNSIRFNYNSFGKAAVTILDLFTGPSVVA